MRLSRRKDKPTSDEERAQRFSTQRALFGGPLQYDERWVDHEEDAGRATLRRTVGQLPRMLALALRLAWDVDRRATMAVMAAEAGRGITEAVVLLQVQVVLAAVLDPQDIAEGVKAAAPAAVVMALALAAGALLGAVTTYAEGRLRPQVEHQARQRFMDRAVRVELEAMEDHRFRKLLESAQYGAQGARELVRHATQVVGGLISLVTAGGVLATLHPVLLPMLMAMVAPRAWSALYIARNHHLSFRRWLQHSRAFRILATLFTDEKAAVEVRVHGMGEFLLDSHGQMAADYLGEQRRLARSDASTQLIAAAAAGATSAVTYLMLGWLLWSGAVALAAAGAAVAAIRSGTGSLQVLVSHLNRMHEDSLYVGDLHEVIAKATGREIPSGGRPLPPDPQEIRFENVHFTYPHTGDTPGKDAASGQETGGSTAQPALNGLSLTIPLGKVTALVGSNGSGKTTVSKLLCGLYQPQAGTIRWDDTDAKTADRAEVFSRFALVSQDFFRWPFIARVNVAVGNPSLPATEERLEQAAGKAGAKDVIESLPRRWDTLLARGFQGGHQLSGGQWQKIGIARGIYGEAPILIVDEPTAALDPEAELATFSRIRELADQGITVVLITHRMASVRMADLVHVLEGGQLIESGTPDQLLTQGGRYAAMFQAQAAQFTTAPGPPAVPAPAGPATRQNTL
ncbi:ABC transporter ATP-binding protein [Streptomyces sp. YIM 98790]|uniref:ABC transporter ATP-binding protein n=1 Tax=Streptomyces sp. YIM 98790 TaxID=2689077 RepID=UPI0028BE6867|nr:ABC transporter ATP-binding protein [Streptomyces sp. YIM 98790]